MKEFEATFPAVPLGVAAARGEMRAVAQRCGMGEGRVADVVLAVSEAVTNAVVHAQASSVTISAQRSGEELTVVVSDDGEGLLPRPESKGLGLGLPIIATLASRFEVVSKERGTELHMTFPCAAEDAR